MNLVWDYEFEGIFSRWLSLLLIEGLCSIKELLGILDYERMGMGFVSNLDLYGVSLFFYLNVVLLY